MKLFDPDSYNFTDSIITKIEYDVDSGDLLLLIDYYQGRRDSINLILRLKGIKTFTLRKSIIGRADDKWTAFTIASITKSTIGDNLQIIIYSVTSFMLGRGNDNPILNCICEEALIE